MKKIALFLLFTLNCFAQFSKTHYIPPITGTNQQPIQNQFIYISSPSLTPVNFTINPIGGTPINGTVSRDVPFVYTIGFGDNTPLFVPATNLNSVFTNKGFIIEAEDQIYAAVRFTASTASNQATGIVSKGLAGLGTQFRIGAFTNTGLSSTGYTNNHLTFISILATENNTTVSFSDIKPGVQLINNVGVGNNPGDITLNSGESFVMGVTGPNFANRDGLIGALINSDKPIVVNCGSFAGTNGNVDNNLDVGIDQIVSVERTGTEYIFVRGFGDNLTEKPLIVAHEDNTEVSINGNLAQIINAGEYLAIDGGFYSPQGNMYVQTSKNVFAYQGVGGAIQANQEMYFVPPLSCQTPKIIDNIPLVNLIGNISYTTNSGINIVTETGAALNFIVDGVNYTIATLPGGINLQGPFSIPGNTDYETYQIVGLTGNISVFSDKQLYLSYFGSNNAATYGGYYSGFTFKPEISFERLDLDSSNCIPNVNLSINTLSPFDTYQWFFNGNPIVGATNPEYTPTEPGFYYLSATVTECNITLISDEIPVSDCPEDSDSDGVNNNIDLDFDNDGIANCTESFGNQEINLSNSTAGTIVIGNYSNSFLGTVNTDGPGIPTPQPLIGNANGDFVTHPANGKENSVTYRLDFAQPISLGIEYVQTANTANLLSSTGEFIIETAVNKTITLLNPDGQLLVDTNYDGIYENGVFEYSSFQIRFRLNSAVPLAAGTGTFRFTVNLTEFISITHKNISDNSSKASFKLIATCIPKDSDGDGISDAMDLDSDNDGVPDNIEAQGENFIASTPIDSNNDGISDAFGVGLVPIDSDGDGILDYLDLDSDNDGIYDLNESGSNATDTDLNGVIDGTGFGNNGLFDNLETGSNNGILNYTIADTNADGILNYISLDSDGDLCNDVIEAGFTDGNGDGLLGNTSFSVDANGLVLGSGGYSPPNQNYTIGAPIEITTQPASQTTCNFENTSFTLTGTISDSYQWQLSSDNGVNWTNISNNTTYAGATTPTLQISGAVNAMNNYRYRVVLNRIGNSCGLTSEEAVLTINPTPILTSPVSIIQCDNDDTNNGISDINLLQKNDVISANFATETFTYFTTQIAAVNNDSTLQITNPIAYNTGNSTVWVRVENTFGCFEVGQIDIFVSATQIPSSFLRTFAKCDDFIDTANDDRDGISTFDFSSVTADLIGILPASTPFTIKYFETEADALAETDNNGNSLEITTISNFRNTNSPNFQQIWIRVESTLDNACFGLGPYIELTVEPLPILTPLTTKIECDDDQDGLFSFDTSSIITDLLGTQNPNDFIITYFDEDNIPIPSPLPNPFLTASQTIKIVVTNATTQDPNGPCSEETTLTFIVDKLPFIANAIPNQITCDIDNEEDGFFNFDTSSFTSTLLGSQTGMSITYFDENGIELNPLPTSFFTKTQTITAVITNLANTNCNVSTTINFIVNPLPQLEEGFKEIICFGVDAVTFDAGLIDGNISDFTYQWFRNDVLIPGETNYNLTVDEDGIYKVIVENTFGCTQERIIEIVYSQPATFENIVVVDLVENNTVSIFVTGSGNYVYSLDSANGLYQTANFFENVIAGIYTVYVKDLNGCGVVEQEIAVLGVPKFFTPNGDGYNDTWKIRGANEKYNFNSTIYIFNRFGKLIKQIGTTGEGWDGTYNGEPLPADDYWYSIEFEDGRRAKGHFSLKR
ncbi:T9SS type B sorting domain-containing protein [Flavobacterium piscinae]|uniref:T9SS type B sorting domain-containing protein n=1 Tax=Flavobacterium piscinae TaxID=2506424 RepID=A0A4Q1KR84_9FLAO|nr:T9SS type B sorting domain-containing protein [Flavobacterium piscinae]RXR31819.1 T9SS type B sorting domain-containing protein [Flavobacterium piscinae]